VRLLQTYLDEFQVVGLLYD